MRDVLVIGGGLAGWRAAEAAVAAGCSVTLVANGSGNSPEIHALNVPVGPGDSVELFIEDTLKSGGGACDPALVEVLCRESVKLAEEFPFDRNADGSYKMIQPLGCSVPRCVSIDHKIGAWALARIKRALEGKIEMMKGRVVGISHVTTTCPAQAHDLPQTVARTPSSLLGERKENQRRQGGGALPTAGDAGQGGGALPTGGGVWQGGGALPTGGGVWQGGGALPTGGGVWQGEGALPTADASVFEVHVDLADGTPAVDRAPTPCLIPPHPSPCPAVVALANQPTPQPFFPDHYARTCIQVGHGEHLPNWTLSNAIYHVCFRLADSIPQKKISDWRAERAELRRRLEMADSPQFAEECQRQLERLNDQLEKFLDSGFGECLLARGKAADCVLETLAHDAGSVYHVYAVGIMPNHVHVLIQLKRGENLSDVLQALKSVSGHRINRMLGRKGTVWEADSYNRIVRDEREFARQVEYVFGNDVVTSWRWEYAGQGEGALPTAGDAGQGEGALPTAGDAGQGEGALPTVTIRGHAVVLATGGWCGKYDFSDNPPELRGDGIALAQSLGAAVRDLDAVQYEPTVALAPERLRGIPVITTMLHEGATFRNRLGDEFLPDKHANKDVISRAIRAEIEAGRGVPARGAPETCGVWYDATGVPRNVLETRYGDTVRRYAACGIDITREPMLVAPAPHTSLGGVVIDARCRVLRADGTPISGLFAAGEVTGGVHGRNRVGGNAGTEVLVFGKIAGESAGRP